MSDIKEKVKFEDAVCQRNREYIDFYRFSPQGIDF